MKTHLVITNESGVLRFHPAEVDELVLYHLTYDNFAVIDIKLFLERYKEYQKNGGVIYIRDSLIMKLENTGFEGLPDLDYRIVYNTNICMNIHV